MATITLRENMLEALQGRDELELPHVWLTAEDGLVLGVFPNAKLKFDFQKDAFVPCGELGANNLGDSSKKERVSLLHLAPRVTDRYEIETDDQIVEVGSATEALVHGLDLIEGLAPGTMREFSKEKARTKRPVSLDRNDLYSSAHPPQHSRELKCGYWVATNNKAPEAIQFLNRAADLAGLAGSFVVRKVERDS